MNEEMEAIEYSKLLIEEQVKKGNFFSSGLPFTKYQKVYIATNENITDYLNIFNLKNKTNALSVLASGDCAFNLICKGINNIDTFDTNSLTKYLVFGLKYAMIQKYTYKEYLSNIEKLCDMDSNLEEITSIIKDLLKYMDLKYKKYWSEIINYNYSLQKNNNNYINLFHMLFINIRNNKSIILANTYLNSEKDYNLLRKRLLSISITFKNINAIDLYKEYDNKYDLILLSNVLDYFNTTCSYNNKKFNINELNKYIDSINSLLKENGILFLKYIFDYATNNYRRSLVFKNNNIKDTELKKQKIYKVKSLDNNCYDGIIIGRKY